MKIELIWYLPTYPEKNDNFTKIFVISEICQFKLNAIMWIIDKVQEKYFTALEFQLPNFSSKQGAEWRNSTVIRIVLSLLRIS